MFCIKCGAQLPDGTTFCTKCGAVQEKAKPKPALAPPVLESVEKQPGTSSQTAAHAAAHPDEKNISAKKSQDKQRGNGPGRKKQALPVMLAAFILAGCVIGVSLYGAAVRQTPAASTNAPSSPAVSAAAELEPEALPEPPADAFVDIEPLSDFSEGLAFARVTLPDGSKKCAYINLEGEIAIELPDGYSYGFAFHDGYAAVSNLQENTERSATQEIGDRSLSHPTRCRYNLIDTQGTLLFNSHEYCYIGPVGEGKVLTRTVTKDYNGTVQAVAFRDLEENIVWEIDADAFLNISTREDSYGNTDCLRAPWTSRYRGGLTTLYSRDAYGGSLYCFDSQGSQIWEFGLRTFSTGADDNISVDELDEYLVREPTEQGSMLRGIYRRNDNTFIPLEYLPTPDHYTAVSLWPEEYALSGLGYFMDGRNICQGGKERFFIYDSAGNILLDKTEPAVQHIESGMDGHWVAELQNGYYGLLDLDGDLSMEPVQEKIVPMGNGLYLLLDSRKAINALGEVQFTIPGEYTSLKCEIQPKQLYPADGRYHEGVIVLSSIYNNVAPVYADLRGNILHSSTDFREYAKWLHAQGPI